MKQRKFNVLLLLFGLLGAVVGFILGELILHKLIGHWPHIIVIGLYFGIMALCIGLGCLIGELISPQLNGHSWRQRYSGLSWKLLVPATLVMLFVAGLLLELGYQVNPEGRKSVQDLVLVIDNSGSMQQTDPDNERLTAAKSLIGQMDGDKRVAIVSFDSTAQLVQPFTPIRTDAEKQAVYSKIDSMQTIMSGGTEIRLALDETIKEIETQGNAEKGSLVIMLSDGFSELDTQTALAPYIARQIPVNTIGLKLAESDGIALLQNIANLTGGTYSNVANAQGLTQAFGKIYNKIGDRTLVTERTGEYADSLYFAIYRVTALVIIGALLGLALGLMFDNRFLARNFAIGGVPAGLLAGFILEKGLSGSPIGDLMIRLLAALVLAALIAIFSLVLPIAENTRRSSGGGSQGESSGRRRGAAEAPTLNRRSSGF
ncbi:VWA domain-containing protein [Paenibacillus polymyxa]|uniref:VWA domain-containing protein n=1 Tax=Paenibacillus polymyxa TaxID=1406 RepID=A0A8I1IQG8_PAEPO|nr:MULTISPECIES: vWA domain-containing protein [Paenibacillus]KAF6574116.1 VWA domain-containing protein [Paenibacillus sp. EKM206P]KAF6588587.1 VWA domain-containing protein [Paenibacillus sp. EKM205P]MBM0632782.1 VWA domain-containing protein [Paenibacillus polymyxa]